MIDRLICLLSGLGLVVLLLTGCGDAPLPMEACVNGVMYLRVPHAITVAVNPDGSIRTCK